MLDFGVAVMDETYGRERRHRWFTFKGYKALLNQENVDESEHDLSVDLANAGGFTEMPQDLFYDTADQLHQHQDVDSREETTKNKRKPPKNPILPDGTVKRGRPRKNQHGTSKRKREDLAEGEREDGQSRPSKRAKIAGAEGDEVAQGAQDTPAVGPTPRKRGRPPKRKPEGEPPVTPTPRKRGRPRKNHTPATTEEQENQDSVEQTLSTATLLISTHEVRPEITRDDAGSPVLSRPEASKQAAQREVPPGAGILPPAGGSHLTPPTELLLPTPGSREPVQSGRQDTDKARTQYPR